MTDTKPAAILVPTQRARAMKTGRSIISASGISRRRVQFRNPPVIEVVCGVQFAELEKMRVPHFGLFWSDVRGDFPKFEDRPPLDRVVEGGPQVQPYQILKVPPLPRVWFLTADDRGILQLQRDRLLFNWKRARDDEEYPSYDAVFSDFERHLKKFKKFVAKQNLGELKYDQFELTYVNHIGPKQGLDAVGREALLVDHMRKADGKRFLPEVEAYGLQMKYALPDDAGALYVTAQTAKSTVGGEPIVRLDLTARGIMNDCSEAGRKAWFALAHDWITHGFVDLTSPVLQREVWKRSR